MRKEIDPELYNYNKFPGPVFRQVGDQILSENLSFELLKNEKEAFDATVFGQRFSEILTKFDYIVGDWSNEQLRLRGFYKEERDVATMDKLSRLDDYLLEYCSYGCAYFVLENKEPHRASFDKKSPVKKAQSEEREPKKRSRNRKQRDRFQKREREKGQPAKNSKKKFRAAQIWEWLYRKRVQSFEEMTNLSKDLIAKLNDQFVVNPLKQRIVQESADGTVKYLFELPDGMLIETVLMRQHYGLSVCVTTQVGCNIGCTFCASGLIKKQRDLNNGEIVSQIMLVQKYFDERGQDERVSHIVVMGIGEPFDNYNNVLKFIRTVNDDKGLAIGARHITVSTSGLAHKIRDFANEGVQVNLAVSLHAPNNDLRSSIMKINRAFPIEKLFAAIEYYIETTNRRVTFEYIMLNEVNDGVEQALELAELLKNIKKLSYVNLIPYNPVSEHDQYSRSPKERVMAFYDTLKKQGVNCVVRQEHGTDIDAACGQLRSNTMKRDREKAIVQHAQP